MNTEKDIPSPPEPGGEATTVMQRLHAWRPSVNLVLIGVVLLFIPVVWEAGQLWYAYDNNAHGFLIFPISATLLWMQRDQIRLAVPKPSSWGLITLAIGLLVETAGYLLRIRFIAMLAIVPVLAGLVLTLHGRDLWRLTRFPICFLSLAAPVPGSLLAPITSWIQGVSSTGASGLAKAIGYAVIQTGNIIEIPGMALEVADVCSGFNKLFTLVTFACLYSYLFPLSKGKRLALILSAIPIAVVSNILRVSTLIAVSSAGGTRALHIAHDWAELFVLAIAFSLFVTLGRTIGCRTPRFAVGSSRSWSLVR